MTESHKDTLARRVVDAHVDLQRALYDKRRYPREAFERFFDAVRSYAEQTRDDRLVHREVVSIVNGLREYLELERKRVPGEVLWKADRLETLLFAGYDPHFDGFEPPGC